MRHSLDGAETIGPYSQRGDSPCADASACLNLTIDTDRSYGKTSELAGTAYRGEDSSKPGDFRIVPDPTNALTGQEYLNA
jgi:hypothetical protein